MAHWKEALRVSINRVLFLLVWLLPASASAQIDADMVVIMGRNALSVDDNLAAIRYFNQAIEAKPFLSYPYYYRAYAKFTLEDYTGAEADCSKSIDLNPYIVEVYQLRGLCRINLEDFSGADSDYSRVLSEQPDDQGSRYNRAICRLQLKNYEQADSDLNVMIRRWPDFYRTYMVKAQVELERKDTTSAIHWLDTLLEKNPKDDNAWSFKGRYALQQEQYTLADSCLTKAIDLRPNYYENYLARAQVRHALHHFDLSIADYNKTLQLVPDHYIAHYNRGLLYSFVGALNQAIEDFDFVLEKEPSNTLARYNRAQLRAQVGNYKGAISDYTQLIKAYPNFTYGYLARAECRRKTGDIKGALNDETFVAKKNLDVAYAKAKTSKIQKVQVHSEHELDNYQQLMEEKLDTARNILGTLYGKVQNESVGSELFPMYALAWRSVRLTGYHSLGYMPEVEKLKSADTPQQRICLTAEFEKGHTTSAAVVDSQAISRLDRGTRCLLKAAWNAQHYDYTSALNEANEAILADSASTLALMQRAFILMRSVANTADNASRSHSFITTARADLAKAHQQQPHNAYIAYNLGCLYAQTGNTQAAIEQFTQAIALDDRLPEAYYNRGLLYHQAGDNIKAASDLSKAGQYGIYQAYAQLKKMR